MKSVIVTGAYGGMGRAAVQRLTACGYRVFALDRAVGDAEEGVVPIQADLTSEQAVQAAVAAVKEQTDSVYAVIHFAGLYMLDSLVELSDEAFRRIVDVNLRAAFLVNKYCLPLLGTGSRIILTTSELAPLDPLPFTGLYAVTKGALDKYAYALRMELQLLDIHVSVLRAGAVATDMLGVSTDALDRFCKDTQCYSCNAARFKAIVNRVEARCVSPTTIAEKVVRILNKKHPSFVYAVNRNPLLLLLQILPMRLRFWIIRCILK